MLRVQQRLLLLRVEEGGILRRGNSAVFLLEVISTTTAFMVVGCDGMMEHKKGNNSAQVAVALEQSFSTCFHEVVMAYDVNDIDEVSVGSYEVSNGIAGGSTAMQKNVAGLLLSNQ